MNHEFQITVPKPCSQQWHSFTPTTRGGFCGSCGKEVIDFTKMSDEQVVAYFQNGVSRTCGKFRPNQLKVYSVSPEKPAKRLSWIAVLAMSVMLFFTSREAAAQRTCKKPRATEQNQASFKTGDVFYENVSAVRITGEVIDDEGQRMPRVNVIRKGTPEGTVTDANGNYEFTITDPSSSETLVFSFIGYTTTEFTVQPNSATCTLNVGMIADVQVLGGAEIATSRISPRRWWWRLKELFD